MKQFGGRLGLLGVSLWLAACGGHSRSPGDGGRDGGRDGGQGGSSTGGSAGTGGVGDVCRSADDDLGTVVPVMIVNRSDEIVFLGDRVANCTAPQSPLFRVSEGMQGPLQELNPCRRPCGELDSGGCTLLCATPRVVSLRPNEAVFTSWSGLYGVDQQLPASCSPSTTEPVVMCQQARRVRPGSFTFSAVAGRSILCDGATHSPPCPQCTLDLVNGGCTTLGALVSGDEVTAKVVVDLDPTYGVYPDRAAQPNPGAGAGANVAAATVTIEFGQ